MKNLREKINRVFLAGALSMLTLGTIKFCSDKSLDISRDLYPIRKEYKIDSLESASTVHEMQEYLIRGVIANPTIERTGYSGYGKKVPDWILKNYVQLRKDFNHFADQKGDISWYGALMEVQNEQIKTDSIIDSRNKDLLENKVFVKIMDNYHSKASDYLIKKEGDLQENYKDLPKLY